MKLNKEQQSSFLTSLFFSFVFFYFPSDMHFMVKQNIFLTPFKVHRFLRKMDCFYSFDYAQDVYDTLCLLRLQAEYNLDGRVVYL